VTLKSFLQLKILTIAALVLLAACTSPQEGIDIDAAHVASSTVPVIYFEEAPFDPAPNFGVPVPGSWSTLRRNHSGVTVDIHTSDLSPGAYTAWWVVFNNPEYCTDGVCGEDDIFVAPFQPIINPDGTFGTPGVVVQVIGATGHVVSQNGVGNFSARLKEGDNEAGLFPGPGLIDAGKAEVHNIVRYHGPMVPEYMPAQIHYVDGGCDTDGGGSLPVGVGFTCFDIQAVVHPLP
jgi:hypothetical protein